MLDIRTEFLEIIARFEKMKPIIITLSTAEIFGIIGIMQLAKATMPGFDSYVKTLREKINRDDILKELRNSNSVNITFSAAEAFCTVTVIQLMKADNTEKNIVLTLAEEAGVKIETHLLAII